MAWNVVSNLPVGWTGWMSYKQWFSGFGTWDAWKYGLVGESQAHCGAMPFRTANDGLNAKKCLRGEDWAFIWSVQASSYALPDPYIWNFQRPAPGTLTSLGVQKSKLTQAYNWLKAFEAQNCWGSSWRAFQQRYAWNMSPGFVPSYGFPDWVNTKQIYDAFKTVIVNPMVVQTPNPANLDDQIRLSTMESLFADYKKLSWTVASLDIGTNVIFDIWDDGTGIKTRENVDIIGLMSREYTGLPTDQKVALNVPRIVFDVVFFSTCTDKQGSQNVRANHRVLVPYEPSVQFSFETLQNDYRVYQCNLDNHPDGRLHGEDVAEAAADILGIDIIEYPPPVPQGSTRYSGSSAILQNIYLICQNQWLVNY